MTLHARSLPAAIRQPSWELVLVGTRLNACTCAAGIFDTAVSGDCHGVC